MAARLKSAVMMQSNSPSAGTVTVLKVLLGEPDKYHWCSQVSFCTDLDVGYTSKVLRKLWNSGHVSRTKDAGDARIFYKLTPAGKAWANKQIKS